MHKLFFSLVLVSGVAFGGIVLAAGGGGGGGSPSCTEDTWTCNEWGDCNARGNQTRTCARTVDCAFGDNPSPATEQQCTPPANTTAPTPQTSFEPQPIIISPSSPASSNAPVQTAPTVSPSQKTALPKISCATDTWKCDEWSGCDADGNQKKICKKTFECPNKETPEPLLTQRCEKLQCGNKTTIRERVSCRLNLKPAGLTRELEIEYLPEECRMHSAQSNERIACVNLYKAYKPCWKAPVGHERSACARQILKVGNDIPTQIKNCNGDATCIHRVREKIYNSIKFRFYDLEERAEDLLEDGKVSKEAVVELTAQVFENKQAFNMAKNKEERKKTILNMREAWQRFIREVKSDKR